MMNFRGFLQRYGNHLVIAVIAAALLIGSQNSAIGALLGFGVAEEVEASAPIQEVVLESAPPEKGEVVAVVDMDSVPILTDYSIKPLLDPITFQGVHPSHQIVTYTVQANDTPIGIAEQFGISPETILGGNPRLSEESSALQTDTVLVILPIDGLLHDVGEGETLEQLSDRYGVPIEEIIGYTPNNLEFPFRLYPGTQVLIPGAIREIFVWSAPSLPERPATSDSTGSGVTPQIQGSGIFIWPVSQRRITQYFWYGHQAVDVAVPEGSLVIASDTGTVTWAGWNVYGYGNLIVVNHGNGYETYYAHLSGINVVPGQIVYQGAAIGVSGNTGRSSGPHLHFEIRYFNTMLEPLGNLR